MLFISNQPANNGKSSLDLIKNEKHRQAVAKLRSSNHKLRIETDRYYLFLRILECASFACRINKVENKIHFLFEWNLYSNLRKHFLQDVEDKYSKLGDLNKSGKVIFLFNKKKRSARMTSKVTNLQFLSEFCHFSHFNDKSQT